MRVELIDVSKYFKTVVAFTIVRVSVSVNLHFNHEWGSDLLLIGRSSR